VICHATGSHHPNLNKSLLDNHMRRGCECTPRHVSHVQDIWSSSKMPPYFPFPAIHIPATPHNVTIPISIRHPCQSHTRRTRPHTLRCDRGAAKRSVGSRQKDIFDPFSRFLPVCSKDNRRRPWNGTNDGKKVAFTEFRTQDLVRSFVVALDSTMV
jgi:hypothetical protein